MRLCPWLQMPEVSVRRTSGDIVDGTREGLPQTVRWREKLLLPPARPWFLCSCEIPALVGVAPPADHLRFLAISDPRNLQTCPQLGRKLSAGVVLSWPSVGGLAPSPGAH